MAEENGEGEAAPQKKKKSKLPLLMGLVLAVVLGGGGFYAVQSGMILGHPEAGGHGEVAEAPPMPDVAYVKLDPLLVNLGKTAGSHVLRFQAQVEVNGKYAEEVSKLAPRIVDVLNGYLRAVDIDDIEDRSALVRLRAQMLRRIQLVTGEGRVRDLLIQEFVLN